ncbi:glycoside hydrolase family 68 protein [Microbacterium sp. zg-YB36]|uniref:glycoside hydrolase family 68 protein n=1 Tax=Microbacterium sp. zg-YB36 TaxID=2969407 RepID=UPI00214ACC36|nr:glycoside hydrolase family 68 protein [Microbacterium sp. zg-YB36]MDL5351439.1 glycoside hydrolase family 68 protein [Microbacterium sp. zg-YB36]
MTFSLDSYWVWDFWIADDGGTFHLFYLHAPKSLKDPELRHRNARIGHATSTDLIDWTDHGEVLGPGPAGSFDETATWTGSVIRGNDGIWRMFYTGASFPSADSSVNTECIGIATSQDLSTWTKRESFVLRADIAHYEKLGESPWPEEAWRDPWVFRDPAGHGWHMLITARAKDSGVTNGGVVGHAWSADLDSWAVRPPVGPRANDFPHLEVLQIAEVGSQSILLFCGPRTRVGFERDEVTTGIWAVPCPDFPRHVQVDDAELIAAAPHYAGRIVHDRAGVPVLMTFIGSAGSEFLGTISDPMPLGAIATESALLRPSI